MKFLIMIFSTIHYNCLVYIDKILAVNYYISSKSPLEIRFCFDDKICENFSLKSHISRRLFGRKSSRNHTLPGGL